MVYRKSWVDHIKHFNEVFSVLKANKLFVKDEKCELPQKEVKYLGHIISNAGVAIDPEKISTMVDWPKLQTVKALRGFFGLASYYQNFIKDFGKIASPLTDMLKKNSFSWALLANKAFVQLKAPVLALPDFSKAFIVECDTSDFDIGPLLRQERPIAFFSHALHGKNLLLSTYEKEILALVLAFQK